MSPFAIDDDELKGVWVGVASQEPMKNHSYLEIESSNSGRFVFVAESKEIFNFEFDSQNVSEPEGYIEVSKSFDSWGAIIVVSGWVSNEDRGLGLLTGQLFMYKNEGDKRQVFNSFPLMMWAVGGPIPPQTLDEDALRKVATMYGSNSPDE